MIAGAGGGVGASAAFNLLRGPLDCELVLADSRDEMVVSHLMDLEQVLEQGATGTVRHGEVDDAANADVLVVAASAPLTVNASRMVYLESNAAILSPLLDALPAGWPGTLILVTNPVDPLCTWAQERTGLDRERVLGYTLNDSLRLRTGIGKALGLHPGRVRAWTVGEHGDLAVPLLDRVTVDGEPVALGAAQVRAVRAFIDGWYVRHVALDSGRSSTWTSGLGLARMVAVCAPGAPPETWPASVMLRGEYGVDGVSLSVPVSLAQGGARTIHVWELTDEQRDGVRAGAELVRNAAEGLVS
jgi:malate/lactate dehydrogenase